MAFKKPGNQEAVKAFYDLYYQPDQVNAFIKAEGFLPVTKSGHRGFTDDPKLKVYLDTLPNAQLTPDRRPDVGQGQARRAAEPRHRRGAAATRRGVLDDLQKKAESGS